MAAVLDKALSTRSKCCFCNTRIDRDTVRVTDKPRHAHLRCAIEYDRSMAHQALVSPSSSPRLVAEVLGEVSRLDPDLADYARTGTIQFGRRPPKPLDDPRTQQILRDLDAEPESRELYSVLADHLQQLGDERGELIALDLAEPLTSAALIRRRELAGSLTPYFERHAAQFSWGIGFLRKIKIPFVEGDLGGYRAQFEHPSCRFLETLHIGTNHRLRLTIPRDVLPPALRTLVVTALLTCESDLTSLPKLSHLTLQDCEAPLIHPTLESLSLVYPSTETLQTWILPAYLPSVRKLSIDRGSDGALATLVSTGWLAQLDELALSSSELSRDDLEALARGLAGRKLARLAIRPLHDAPLDRSQLAPLCNILEIPSQASDSDAIWVKHRTKPGWGRGRILREVGGKLEIEFSLGGTRVLEDGPHLQRVERDS